MISLPNLPSDSLYKFTFIGGLFSFFFCLYISYALLSEHLNQRMEYVTKIIPEEAQKWYQDTLNIKRINRFDSLYNVTKNEIEKERLMEKLMMLSDQSAIINYSNVRYKNIRVTREMGNDVTFTAIFFLMTVGFASLFGALFGWNKWSAQQHVLDDLILKQYQLQNIELEIRDLELQEKVRLLNLMACEPGNGVLLDDLSENPTE